MNTIILLGRLTADVDLKESNKTQYAQFSIAVDRTRNNGVDFINCVAFNKLAELMNKYCSKGRQVLVNGRLQTSQNKGRTYYTVIANQVTFLQQPRGQQGQTAPKNSDNTNQGTVAQGAKPF